MLTRVHSVLRSGERPASHQCNGECTKPYSDFRNREHSSRAHQNSDKTYQSTDVSDEIPEFLTSLRTSAIYTLEKVGKETVARRAGDVRARVLQAGSNRAARPAPGEYSRKFRGAFAIRRKRREDLFARGSNGGSGCREIWFR